MGVFGSVRGTETDQQGQGDMDREEQIDRDRIMNRDRWTGTWMRRTGTGKRGKGLLCLNGFQKSQLRLYIQNRVGTIFSLAQHCFHA